jgi:alpha-galactosidase/6-phospho-beta-glucosidase family protein
MAGPILELAEKHGTQKKQRAVYYGLNHKIFLPEIVNHCRDCTFHE